MSSLSERFADKVVLITGAASGIGRATAERLAAEGATIVAADLAPVDYDVATKVSVDVSSPEQVTAMVDRAIADHGRLDVVCNIAGILRFNNFEDITLDEWNQVLAVNLTGTFLVCQAVIPHLLETRGNIVNTASTAALAGHPWTAAYSASKGGVLALSQTSRSSSGARVSVRTSSPRARWRPRSRTSSSSPTGPTRAC